ncbi:hypothetical protein ACWKSP_29760 [Micromonosporaceae bacterium Da 78-11]
MKIGRAAVAALALATTIGLSGCGPQSGSTAGSGATSGSGTTGAGATTTAPAEPSAELVAAASKIAENSTKIKISTGGAISLDGFIDTKNRKMELNSTLGSDGAMIMRQVGDALYVKLDGSLGSAIGATPGKWMHIDAGDVTESSALNLSHNDPQAVANLLAAGTTVEKTGDHAFAGIVDMTKAKTANAASLKVLGDKAKAVPFTATTDDEGRLTDLTIDMSSVAAGAGSVKMAYSDFGVAVPVEAPPAAEVVEMPAKFRKLMGT